MSSLREQAKSLEFKNTKGIVNCCMLECTSANRATDYDPEDDAHQSEDEEDIDVEDETIGETGREHYESVGKSKLRKPVEPILGARYGGVAVSRKDLEVQDDGEDEMFPASDDDEDDEDPFAAKNGTPSDTSEISGLSDMEDAAEIEEDDEINSDEALGESDVERFKNFTFRGSKINSRSELDGNESASQKSDEEDEEGLNDDDRSTEDSEGSDSDSDVDMDDEDEDEDEDQDDESNASSVSPLLPGSPCRLDPWPVKNCARLQRLRHPRRHWRPHSQRVPTPTSRKDMPSSSNNRLLTDYSMPESSFKGVDSGKRSSHHRGRGRGPQSRRPASRRRRSCSVVHH